MEIPKRRGTVSWNVGEFTPRENGSQETGRFARPEKEVSPMLPSTPGLTLNTYSHLFSNTDDKAAAVIDALAK